MLNINFITEKRRTVRRTRMLSKVHLVLSVVSALYIVVYAEVQRRAKDSKELGAALAALSLILMQMVRAMT